jgi:RNA recognition motif. (a.k.a. RRM, RBD, or RNP domain)
MCLSLKHTALMQDALQHYTALQCWSQMRWLTDRTTGEFRGCGFLEFPTVEDADKAATMHGKELQGRALKIDWDA